MTPRLCRRILLLVPLVVALNGAPLHAAGGSDPEVILDEIYGQVDAMCGGESNGPAYDIVEIAKTYFAPALANKIAKASDDDALDFDFLVDGQDCKVTDLDLKVMTGGDMTAVGRATFRNMGEARTIDFEMAKAGDGWEVTDIVYRHRAFSLKDAF